MDSKSESVQTKKPFKTNFREQRNRNRRLRVDNYGYYPRPINKNSSTHRNDLVFEPYYLSFQSHEELSEIASANSNQKY